MFCISALYNFGCIFYIFERDNYLPNFIFTFAAMYSITYVQIQIRPWHVDQYLNDTKLYFFSYFERWVNGRNLDVKLCTIKYNETGVLLKLESTFQSMIKWYFICEKQSITIKEKLTNPSLFMSIDKMLKQEIFIIIIISSHPIHFLRQVFFLFYNNLFFIAKRRKTFLKFTKWKLYSIL